jgi:peptidyl-prolyl cis-trans isomerase B (cyclophilin B)
MRAIALAPTEDPVATSKNQEREAREARDRLKAYNARQAVHSHQVKRRWRDNLFAGLGVLVIAAAAAGVQFVYFSTGPGAPTPAPSDSASAAAGANVGDVPDVSVSEFRTWTGVLTINGIPLDIELDGAAAPQAVAAFVTDVKSGYLTGKTCHRLVSSASAGLLQCGSADGTGATDPTYSYGPLENVPADNLYLTGYLAIARTGDNAYGNGHQFFIVFSDTTLPRDSAGGYTVIGKVTNGIDALVAGPVSGGVVDGAQDGAPVTPTKIDSVTIQ